jgi:aminoglycoside phosphotransferase (APT) family kinase protein
LALQSGCVRMHADEIETDAGLVRRLLTEQFRQWADLPITRVASAGTDNALYRLGEDLVARLTNPALAANARHVIREVLAES